MNIDLSVNERGTLGRRVVANTSLLVFSKIAAGFIGLASLIITTRILPISEVGIILFLHAYMLLFAEVATFQSWQAVIRFGTPNVADGDTPALLRLLRFCIALDFVGVLAAFIFALAGLFCLGWILPFLPVFQGEAAESIRLLVILGVPYMTLILVHQGGMSTGLFRLFDKFRPLAVHTLIMPIFRFSGVVVAALSGWDLEGFLAAWFFGSLIGYLALSLMAGWELRVRNMLGPLFSKWPSLNIKRPGVWPFVLKTNLDSSLATGMFHLPVLLVMPIFGNAYVSAYKIADDIAKILTEGMLLFDRVIYPEYARLITRGQGFDIWQVVLKTMAILFGIGLVVLGTFAFAGPPIISGAFGTEYQDAVILSILLTIGAVFTGVVAPLYPVFYAAGRPGRAVFARGAGLVCYVALVFILSHCIGKTGPAWAVIAGNALSVLLAVYLAKRVLSVHKDEV